MNTKCLNINEMMDLVKAGMLPNEHILNCESCKRDYDFCVELLHHGKNLSTDINDDMIDAICNLDEYLGSTHTINNELKLEFDSAVEARRIGIRTGYPTTRWLKYQNEDLQCNLRMAPGDKQKLTITANINPILPGALKIESGKQSIVAVFDYQGLAYAKIPNNLTSLKFSIVLESGDTIELSQYENVK